MALSVPAGIRLCRSARRVQRLREPCVSITTVPVTPTLRTIVALFVLYVVAAKAGLSLAAVNPSATAVWPPTGIAIAACLLAGRTAWPAIFAAAFVANLTTAGSVAT